MKKILKSIKASHPASFFITPLVTIVFFGTVFTCIDFLVSRSEQHALDGVIASFDAGIKTDLAYLSVQGDQVAKNPQLLHYLSIDDHASIISTLLGERNLRSIGLMGVTDAQGHIIARTKSVLDSGEQAFVTSPQGRALAAGTEHVASVEVSSFDPHQVFMTTGRKIMNDAGVMVGALFANYLLDDGYARRFVNAYLSPSTTGAHVVFYTDYYGPYGMSFDGGLKEQIYSYISSDPTIIKSDTQKRVLTINRTDYVMTKVPFKGLEKTATGALIFVPVYTLFRKILLAALVSTVLLLMYAFVRHLYKKSVFHVRKLK
jgi:hypothetical protein